MILKAGRRRWANPAIVAVVLIAGAAAGVLLRELQPALPAGSPAVGTPSVTVPADEPGSPAVALVADVAAHPDADRVRRLLQDYFDAINKGDYELWSSTVTAQRVRDTGREVWREQYRTTLDGTIVVHRLEARPGGGLVALLSFTSVQEPADAPPDLPVRCIRWRVSYPLISESGELRLMSTSPNASLRVPC